MIALGILSKKKRRIGVVLNIAALFLTVFLFELVRFDMGISKIAGIVLMGLSLLTVILSFITVFGSSGI